MNEGHSAFLGLERVRALMSEHGLSFAEARLAVWSTSVFTTHTPVPAGNESFDAALVLDQARVMRTEAGAERGPVPGFGQPGAPRRAPRRVRSHAAGLASGRTLQRRQPPARPRIAPHVARPVAGGAGRRGADPPRHQRRAPAELDLARHPGPAGALPGAPRSEKHAPEVSIWDQVDNIADEELWRTHERRRERMIWFARRRLVAQLRHEGASDRDLQAARVAPASGCAHHRLRPPFRRLQAGRSAVSAGPSGWCAC